MKKYCFLLCFFWVSILLAQSKEYTLQYEAVLLVQKDTITLLFNKKGNVVFFKDNKLTKVIAKGLSTTFRNAKEEMGVQVLFDTNSNYLTLKMDVGKSNAILQMYIPELIPEEATHESPEAIICMPQEKEGDLTYYSLASSTEPDKPLILALDTKKPFSLNKIFDYVLQLLYKNKDLSVKLPSGFPMEMIDHKGKKVMETISLKEIKKNISLTTQCILE
ncbi:MAG: hypothetical protein OIF50_00965 [Flavobacteriaceae bacterium]|nr:hypothetical protein [Flavobacteriaceae bacterium]